MGTAVSPHRQEYVAERYDEDEIVPFQLYGAVTPGFPFKFESLNPCCCRQQSRTHTCAGKPSNRVPEGEGKNTYFLGIAGQERCCECTSE